ncbi:MAG: SM-20-related protein [Idiomarinaceae bacterium HL-53]|nr:MAG: SM-20-related protein [Idiomarinaceae bacterium HL-53]CUS47607.1 SM-20-related protein [Idiomarinaceae bacterium HL-53]
MVRQYLLEVNSTPTKETLDTSFAQIADALVARGYVVVPNFIDEHYAQQLFDYAQALPQGIWHLAGVGREQQHSINTHIRNDEIHWLSTQSATESIWLSHMTALQRALNRHLFLGLFDYECHLARFPAGSFYKKHLDAFKGRSNRVLTTVAYLNSDWNEADGGQLVIYGERGEVLETVLPQQGTFVVFLSDQFVHEVKVSNRTRYSMTGWFRHNTTTASRVDPAR